MIYPSGVSITALNCGTEKGSWLQVDTKNQEGEGDHLHCCWSGGPASDGRKEHPRLGQVQLVLPYFLISLMVTMTFNFENIYTSGVCIFVKTMGCFSLCLFQ